MVKDKRHLPTPTPPQRQVLKVVIPLEADPDGPHPQGAETVWVRRVDENSAILENVPFAAYGLSLGDELTLERVKGRLTVSGVSRRSGHSTYRIFLAEGLTPKSQRFTDRWAPLQATGCSFESMKGSRLVAVDVPAGADIHEVYQLLEESLAQGIWDFEEAHVGHEL